MKYKDENGNWKELYLKSGGDTLPIGTIVEYNGTEVPGGYEKVQQNEATYLSVNATGSSQSFTAGTYQVIQFKTVESDTKNGWNSSTYTYTIPEDGWYYIYTSLEFSVGGTSRTVCRIEKNGSAIRYGINQIKNMSGSVQLMEIRYCAKGEQYRIQAKCDDIASTLNAGVSSFFQIFKIK